MSDIVVKSAVPILCVSDVPASAAFYREKLGFEIDFLYGEPPFYGSVSRGEACLHLRAAPPIAMESILATIEVSDIQKLFEEFAGRGTALVQTPARQPWGGTDILVRDPDGNVISFVTYDVPTSS